MFALHKDFLIRWYPFGLLDFLLCLLSFGLGTFHTHQGLRKLGHFRLQIMLHGLVLLAKVLGLLLYLAHSSTLLFVLLAFQGRLVFGLGQQFLQGRHFGGGPCYTVTAFWRYTNHFCLSLNT